MLMYIKGKIVGFQKWLPFAAFLLFLCGMQSVEARTLDDSDTTVHKSWHEVPHLDNYSVQFFSKDATCYDNGKIGFILVNVSDPANPIPINQVELDTLMLADFGIGQKGVLLDTSIHWHRSLTYHPGDTTWVIIEPGTFNITLEFTHRHADNHFWIVDTTVAQTVNLLYVEPEISPLSVTAYYEDALGNIPSLDCDETGRIQLRIRNGQQPYTIKYVKHGTTDTLTVNFPTYQHNGTDSTKADYQHYYTIDKLASGQWDFFMEDNCGYRMPRVSQQVGEVPLPDLSGIEVIASSGDIHDNNVVKINAILNNSFPYYEYIYQAHMQYRFIVDSVQETSEWKDFPVTGGQIVTISEPINKANKFCEFYGKDIEFQLKLKEDIPSETCPAYTRTRTFQIYGPNKTYFRPNSRVQVVDSVVATGDCGTRTYMHYDSNYIAYAYTTYQPNHANPNNDHTYIRYHITYPLVWSYKHVGLNEYVKYDTIPDDITKRSYFARQDLLDQYPTLTGPQVLERELKDANGCPLFRDSIQVQIETTEGFTAGPEWKIEAHDPVCCIENRSITISEGKSNPTENYDGMTIRLVESPDDNLYNFTVRYDDYNSSWIEVQRDKGYLNQAILSGSPQGDKFIMSKTCLPSGTYKFEITNAPCHIGETITLTKYLKETVRPDTMQDPQFEIIPGCSEEFITYTQGQIAKIKEYRPSSGANLDLLKQDTIPLTTYISMVNGPVGGYSSSDLTEYQIGDPIRITVPSDSAHPYVFKIYTHENLSNICEDYVFYDTVFYEAHPVRFDFAMGLLCDTTKSKGTVYVRAHQGNPPYHYRVFDQPNLEGNLIGELTLGEGAVARFDSVLMQTSEQLSCEVSDSCGSAFRVNFFPQSLAELQKTWFDDNKTVAEVCEGTYVTIHALQAGLIFQYTWFIGDDTIPTWVSSDPSVFIARGADTAVYRVEISQTGCQGKLMDSVTVYPLVAPSLMINGTDDILTVCPGQAADISFVPHSDKGTDVKFDVYFENEAGIEVRHFGPVPSDQPVVIEDYTSSYNTKIYPKSIVDAECNYGIADPGDTLYFMISDNLVNPCHIYTTDETVCLYETATLSASCTEVPSTLRWYSDFSLTDTLLTVPLTNTNPVYYYLDSLDRYTALFVNVEKSGMCPSNNVVAGHSVKMGVLDTTTLTCMDSYYFYDDGGHSGDYSTTYTFQEHLFVSTAEGLPVTMHFNSLDLSPTSYLFVFSGSRPITDSLLLSMEEGTVPPDLIMSHGDTMLVVFMPGPIASSGWDAVVRPAPGVAVADVHKRPYVTFRDEVCQNHRMGHDCYYDQYNFIGDSAQLWSKVEKNVQTAGTYIYEKHHTGSNGCDSITALILNVKMPPYSIQNEVILSLDTPYWWHSELITTSGQYTTQVSNDGCDSLIILNLLVLKVDTSTNNICYLGSTEMGIKVYTPDMKYYYPRVSVGDVLCTDGSVLRVDSFLTTDKTAMGIVFFIEPNDPFHQHGRAVALYDAYGDECDWAAKTVANNVHSITRPVTNSSQANPHIDAMLDMNGYENCLRILETATSAGINSVQVNAPAFWYCWYYDHLTHTTGQEHKQWYLPALGELNLLYANRFVVGKTMKILESMNKAEIMRFNHFWNNQADSKYWSSTEDCVQSGNTFQYDALCLSSNGQLNNKNTKYKANNNPRYVRAIIKF